MFQSSLNKSNIVPAEHIPNFSKSKRQGIFICKFYPIAQIYSYMSKYEKIVDNTKHSASETRLRC